MHFSPPQYMCLMCSHCCSVIVYLRLFAMSSPDSTQWSCSMCTYSNPSLAKTCEICGGTERAKQTTEAVTPTVSLKAGKVQELQIIDQWGAGFLPSIKEFHAPSAICGYIVCAAAPLIASKFPLIVSCCSCKQFQRCCRSRQLRSPRWCSCCVRRT